MPYELIEEEEEPKRNSLQAGGRQLGRIAASGVAGAVGGIGDLANIASMGLEKIGAVSPESAESFRERTLTTSKIKEGFQQDFPSLKPENKVEKFADDIFETLGSLINPFSRAKEVSAIYSGLRKFGLSIGANLGKEITDQFLSEPESEAGHWVKSGLLFLGSLIDPKLSAREAAKQYKQAETFLPPGANISSVKVLNELNAIEKGITKGRPKSSLSNPELFVLDKIDKARSLDQNGRIGVEQLVAQKKSLNEDLGNLFPAFGAPGAKTVRNQAKRVTKSLNEAINEYGESNPGYLKHLRAGDEIYATLAKSEGFANWVKQNFPHSPWSRAGLLFAEKTIGQVPKILYRAFQSPEIRNLYIKAIAKAGAEDAREFAKIMDQLDEKLIEEENKEHWEAID